MTNEFRSQRREPSPTPKLGRLIGKLVVVLALMLAGYLGSRGGLQVGAPAGDKQAEPRAEQAAKQESPAESAEQAEEELSTTIKNVVIHDESGDVVYRGDVDLKPTLERIAAGKRLRFANDGSTFQNRERRLPKKASGYYSEWVHPTPKLSGPGPQRIVTGEQGEAYYTPDHYRTFQRIK